MAPTIGRVALDNGFHGSIPRDWVAPPPQNIHCFAILSGTIYGKVFSFVYQFFYFFLTTVNVYHIMKLWFTVCCDIEYFSHILLSSLKNRYILTPDPFFQL